MSTILITGVNRGIGLQALKHYAALGWQVIGTCRDPDSADEARAVAGQGKVALYPLEVSDTAAVNALAGELAGTAIDVLFLNAGMMGKASMVLGKLDADDFRRVMDVNVVALAMCVQAFRAHVAASERGVIVGMGSFLGSIGSNNDGGGYSYRASKAAVHAIMRSVSIDLRDEGVLAIAMHPGWVQTEMGGPDATISTEESVRGMAAVIAGLRSADSGKLLTYSGEELPW
jgi:NAD(P)-dependent dehydrogenase (short-subunit alcohol dehydrogenase family)